VFGSVEKLLKFLLEFITLVSSASKMASCKVFIFESRSLINIMKSKGPKINPWGTL
jgi:hypothetical protein